MAHFDSDFKLVSSYLFSPLSLAMLRLLIALFTIVTLIFSLVWGAVKTNEAKSFFSYFTNLTFIGLCAYFFASGVQTVSYFLNVKKGHHEYWLQTWPHFLQYLHTLLLTTIVSFPIIVTIVYWVLLASAESFATPFSSFSNVTKHALNSVFALFEIFFTNIGPLPWVQLPITILLLLGYLGVAYITHATQGFYTYSFLDPKKQGKRLAGYIVGIAVGQVIVFLIVRGIILLRERLTRRRLKNTSDGASRPNLHEQVSPTLGIQ